MSLGLHNFGRHLLTNSNTTGMEATKYDLLGEKVYNVKHLTTNLILP